MKHCEHCGKLIERKGTEGPKSYAARKFCSKKCAGYRPIPLTKECATCHGTKIISEFPLTGKGRPRNYCYECSNAMHRRYYQQYIETIRERKRLWMKAERLDPARRPRQLERAKRAWANGGALKAKEHIRAIQENQPFRWKLILVRRLNRTIAEADIVSLWNAQDGRCALTGEPLDARTAEIDHIVPKTRGGATTIDNLRWVSKNANRAKGALTDQEFLNLCEQIVNWQSKSALTWLGRRIIEHAD